MNADFMAGYCFGLIVALGWYFVVRWIFKGDSTDAR
jgi:hypothetical protein